MPWLNTLFVPLYYSSLVVSDLCSDIPPSLPQIDLSTLNATANTLLQVLRVVAWPSLCECVPGTPSAVPPPLPTTPKPPGWPDPITFTCDPANLCASLEAIRGQLANLQTTLGLEYALTTLIQRYSLPFAFIPGAVHGPLTGQGTFKVSRLCGLRYQVVASDPNRPVTPDVPPYKWDLGWTSVTDDKGLLQERRVNRDSFDWLPKEMPMALTVGYSLTPGTTITIQELEAEP